MIEGISFGQFIIFQVASNGIGLLFFVLFYRGLKRADVELNALKTRLQDLHDKELVSIDTRLNAATRSRKEIHSQITSIEKEAARMHERSEAMHRETLSRFEGMLREVMAVADRVESAVLDAKEAARQVAELAGRMGMGGGR